jgi:hypothetical protein
MKKAIIAITTFGAIAFPAFAGDYPNYPVGPGPNYPVLPAPMNGWGYMPADLVAQAPPYAPGWGLAYPCNSSPYDYYRQRDGEKLRRLVDFLCYKPNVPCEFWLRPTCYVPPNYTMFPPCCNATGCDCNCGYGARPHLFRTARSGCGPTCNPGYAPMANGCPVMPMPMAAPAMPASVPTMPAAMPVNGWQMMTSTAPTNGWQMMPAANPAARPATVTYTKPASTAISYSAAPVFVPVTQKPVNAMNQNTAGTFTPSWLNQQTGSQYPVSPTGYNFAPRQ